MSARLLEHWTYTTLLHRSFSGSALYQDYYPSIASTQFPYNEVKFAGDGNWLVTHTIVSFYDLYKLNSSDPRVNVSDINGSAFLKSLTNKLVMNTIS